MASKNIFNSVNLDHKELGDFFLKDLKNSLAGVSGASKVVGSSKTKLDPICPPTLPKKPKAKKK